MALIDGLVAYWSLNNTLSEEHNGYTLTDHNTVPLNASGLVYPSAGDFENTSSQYLTRADNANIASGAVDFTIAAWVKPESVGIQNDIAGAGTSGGFAWRITTTTGNKFQVRVASGTGEANGTNSTDGAGGGPDVVAGTWYFVVVVHVNGDKIHIFTSNNALTGFSANYTFGVWNSGGDFTIGAGNVDYFPSYYDGLIGPVMMWKRAITYDEIVALYNGGAGLTYAAIAGAGAAGYLLVKN